MSRDAIATTRAREDARIAGITLLTAMLATPSMPQRSGSILAMFGWLVATKPTCATRVRANQRRSLRSATTSHLEAKFLNHLLCDDVSGDHRRRVV